MSSSEAAERLVKVYKTRRKADTYLYVDAQDDLKRVPEGLLERFGAPELALSFTLGPQRRLARAGALEVLAAIRDQGYFLQMPAEGGVDALIERGLGRPTPGSD